MILLKTKNYFLHLPVLHQNCVKCLDISAATFYTFKTEIF